MALPPLDEGERRLLREYRLTKFPPRHDVRRTTASPTATRPHKDHHHHNHHHHHHHNNNSHKRHELTADELNKMLELASELGVLKLMPEKLKKADHHHHCYIFEKVNYIRRMNQRRKARRKSKKMNSAGTKN